MMNKNLKPIKLFMNFLVKSKINVVIYLLFNDATCYNMHWWHRIEFKYYKTNKRVLTRYIKLIKYS